MLPEGHAIEPYRHLMTRVDTKQIDALLAANRQSLETPPAPVRHAEAQVHQENKAVTSEKPSSSPQAAPTVGEGVVSIDDFGKIDLRIARIANAEHVEGADKLLKLTLDLGPLGTRQVFAGIKSAYSPSPWSAG